MTAYQKTTLTAVLLAAFFCASVCSAHDSLRLEKTVFEEAAKTYGVNEYILYAIALVESRRLSQDGLVRPYIWALRSNISKKSYYPATHSEALALLDSLLSATKNVDIGLMQINCYWNCDKVDNPQDLLDLHTSVHVGAQVLRIAQNSTNDIILGIGRYHNWKDEEKAREYGTKVYSLATKLAAIR